MIEELPRRFRHMEGPDLKAIYKLIDSELEDVIQKKDEKYSKLKDYLEELEDENNQL